MANKAALLVLAMVLLRYRASLVARIRGLRIEAADRVRTERELAATRKELAEVVGDYQDLGHYLVLDGKMLDAASVVVDAARAFLAPRPPTFEEQTRLRQALVLYDGLVAELDKEGRADG